MPFSSGDCLGPYEVTALIGAGGMGEVYQARDTRLGRDVAVKVVPPRFARDPERIKRFEQEARATGALNHPNVCAIYDIGTHEGSPYVVMELLQGETLRQTLQSGALPVRKAIDYVAQAPVLGRGTVRKLDVPVPLGTGQSLAWATDGRALTFSRTTDGASNLWRQPIEGGPATRLTNYTSADTIVAHAWSRDGKLLALVRGTTESQLVMLRDVAGSR